MQCHSRVQWISSVDCTPGLAREDLLLKIDQQATNSSCVDRNHAPRRLNNWLSQLMSLRKTALRLSLNIRNQCKLQQCVCRWWKCSDPIIGSSTRNIRGTCHVHCAFSKPCHQELRYTLLWIHTLKIALNSWSSGGMNHHRPTSSVAAEPNCRETAEAWIITDLPHRWQQNQTAERLPALFVERRQQTSTYQISSCWVARWALRTSSSKMWGVLCLRYIAFVWAARMEWLLQPIRWKSCIQTRKKPTHV